MVASPICKSQAQLASWRYGLSDFLLGIFACQVASYDASCQVDLLTPQETFMTHQRWMAITCRTESPPYQWQWHWAVLWKTNENQAFATKTGRASFSCSSNFFQLVSFGHLMSFVSFTPNYSPLWISLKVAGMTTVSFLGGIEVFFQFSPAQKDCNELNSSFVNWRLHPPFPTNLKC